MPVAKKTSNSLKELGYTITPLEGKDSAGNELVFLVTPAPFYVKQSKRGKLKAYRHAEDKVETTIGGLYGFEVKDGDLIGKRSPAPGAKTAEAPAETAAA